MRNRRYEVQVAYLDTLTSAPSKWYTLRWASSRRLRRARFNHLDLVSRGNTLRNYRLFDTKTERVLA